MSGSRSSAAPAGPMKSRNWCCSPTASTRRAAWPAPHPGRSIVRKTTRLYLDLAFFEEMKNRFHAPGEFAEAYVIAHEVGHHVQNSLGILPEATKLRRHSDERRSNEISVRLELQADCFAGVWAHHADRMKHIIEQGDVEAAMNAAAVVGGGLDNLIGQPGAPQWLKQGQRIQLVVLVVDDDEPLYIGMATKPFEDGVAPWFALQIRSAGDEGDAVVLGAEQARRIEAPV